MHYFVGQGKKEAEKAFENVTGKCAGKHQKISVMSVSFRINQG